MSNLLYGANIHANGIRQHYLRYGGTSGRRAERDAVILIPGITSPAITWGFVGERLGREFDTYVLDVREPHEWDEGHAPGATSIPLSELNERVGEVPTDRPVLVVCHSGMRSARATDALRGVGVDARNVVGGMLAWRDAGGTVVADDGHPGASVD